MAGVGSIAGLPSRHMDVTKAHRRESSLSTNTSSCSSQTTRVLPFATAFATGRPQEHPALYIPASRRFAVARPRRVVTDSGGKTDSVRPPRMPVGGRRHSAAIGTLLPVGGSRTRAIIGLGLTLNPADAVVRLKPRHTTLDRSLGSIKERHAVQLNSPVTGISEKEEPKEPDLSPGISLFASPQLSLTPSESLHSPRTGDPQPVTLPQRAAAAKAQESMSVAEVPSVEDLRSFVSCTSSLSPVQPRLPQTPVTGAASDITCLLCFERVLVASGRTRGHAMRCPSCFGILKKEQ